MMVCFYFEFSLFFAYWVWVARRLLADLICVVDRYYYFVEECEERCTGDAERD